jgi:hypothetical protein
MKGLMLMSQMNTIVSIVSIMMINVRVAWNDDGAQILGGVQIRGPWSSL